MNIKDFGAIGDGVTNDTTAFIKAADAINKAGGGTLVLEPKTYIVGQQEFSGASGKGYSYSHVDILNIQGCTNEVVIQGNGAILKVQDGLHYGAFDPATGVPYNAPTGQGYFLDVNYAAQIGTLLLVENNKKVTVSDITLDGNLSKLIVAGWYGDTGIQLGARGIQAYDNDSFTATNVKCNNHGLDGFGFQNTIPSEGLPEKQIFLSNFEANGNGRLGIAYTGGNHIRLSAGTSSNNGSLSAPGSGLDIEAEGGLTYNGVYESVEFKNNKNTGIVCDLTTYSYKHTFKFCKFYSDGAWAIWAHRKQFRFEDCKISGGIAGAYVATSFDDPDRTIFLRCTFDYMDINDPAKIDFGGGTTYAEFMACNFKGGKCGNVPYTNGVKYTGCEFEVDNDPAFYAYPYGEFYGTTKFVIAPIARSKTEFGGCHFYGPWYLNGVLQNPPAPPPPPPPVIVTPPIHVKKTFFQALISFIKNIFR